MISTSVETRQLLGPIRRIHELVRDAVVVECQKAQLEQLAAVSDDDAEGDTIYAVDRVSEPLLIELFQQEIGQAGASRPRCRRNRGWQVGVAELAQRKAMPSGALLLIRSMAHAV